MSDANPFYIKNGILLKYTGTEPALTAGARQRISFLMNRKHQHPSVASNALSLPALRPSAGCLPQNRDSE